MLASACSLLSPPSEQLRAQQVEAAVLPVAATALETGQLETARRLYRRLLEVDDGSATAHMGLGDIAFQEEEPALAARHYRSAIKRADEPEVRHSALLAHGRAALAAGRINAARRSFAELTRAKKKGASATRVAWGHNGVGLTLLLQDDLHGAVAELEKAVELAPEEERLQANLESARAALEDLPPAAERDRADEAADSVAPGAGPEAPEAALGAGAEGWPEAAPPVESPLAGGGAAAVDVEASREGARAALEDLPPAAERDRADEAADSVAPGAGPEAPEAALGAGAEGWPEAAPPVESAPGAEAVAVDPSLPPERVLVVIEQDGAFLQFGAFSELDNADAIVDRLRALTDFPVASSEAPSGDGLPFQRVRIGPLLLRETLLRLVGVLEAAGYEVVNAPPPTEGLGPFTVFASQPLETWLIHEGGEQFLQFGAYSGHATAEALAVELRFLTERVVGVVETEPSKDPLLYRVRIGPLEPDDGLIDSLQPQPDD